MHQGNQTMLSGVNEVTCLFPRNYLIYIGSIISLIFYEYGQLKVHYEILNKKFRNAQKTIDQHNYYFKRNSDALEEALNKKSRSPIPVKSVAKEFKLLSARLATCLNEVDAAIKMEIQAAAAINSAAEYLKQGTSNDPEVVSVFRKQRANRFIIEYLLRNGYFETAQKLAEYVNAENINKNVFHVAKQVEESLKRRDLSICLHWVLDNRSKLHRLQSSFENEVRTQQLIELIKDGKKLEAVNFMRTYYGNTNPSDKWTNTVMQAMGLFAVGPETQMDRYRGLVNEERWDRMIQMFRDENARIFRFSGHTAFSACLQVGIAAHKTSVCVKDPKSRCVVCRDLFELAAGLPCAHVENSRLICQKTGEQLNDKNHPIVLPNGYVYGEHAIDEMISGNKVICPQTGAEFSVGQLKKLYIL